MTTGLPVRPLLAALAILAFASDASAQAVSAPQEDVAGLRARLQPDMAPAHRPMPKDQRVLDGWLAGHDEGRLVQRLGAAADAAAVTRDMNWEQTRIFDGAGLTVVLAYVRTLWAVADAVGGDDAKGFRDSAAVYSLYALNLVSLDGQKCADRSAPDTRFDQVIQQTQPMLAYLRGLPRGDRMTTGSLSVALETATSQARKDDWVLCSGGLDQYDHDQNARAQGVAPAAVAYAPAFLSPEVWGPEQDRLRQALPAELTGFLTTPEEAALSAPPAAPPSPSTRP